MTPNGVFAWALSNTCHCLLANWLVTIYGATLSITNVVSLGLGVLRRETQQSLYELVDRPCLRHSWSSHEQFEEIGGEIRSRLGSKYGHPESDSIGTRSELSLSYDMPLCHQCSYFAVICFRHWCLRCLIRSLLNPVDKKSLNEWCYPPWSRWPVILLPMYALMLLRHYIASILFWTRGNERGCMFDHQKTILTLVRWLCMSNRAWRSWIRMRITMFNISPTKLLKVSLAKRFRANVSSQYSSKTYHLSNAVIDERWPVAFFSLSITLFSLLFLPSSPSSAVFNCSSSFF